MMRHSRWKTFAVFTIFTQLRMFYTEQFTRLGIHCSKKLLPQKFSRELSFYILTVKVFPLKCFVVYGSYSYIKFVTGSVKTLHVCMQVLAHF